MVRTARGALPVVIAAGVVPASACGKAHGPKSPSGAGTSGGAGTGTITTASTAGRGGASGTGVSGAGTAGLATGLPFDAGGAIFGSGGQGGVPPGFAGTGSFDAGMPLIGNPSCEFVVELPPEGVPAEPGQICAATMVPVDSNRAATVKLSVASADRTQVNGGIAIADALSGMIVGVPAVEVLDATDPSLLMFTLDSITPAQGGFTFQAHFAQTPPFTSQGLTRITVRVSLQVACSPAPISLHSVTDIHLCGSSNYDNEWVSSGGVCSVCRIIAEMAPSPIVPDKLGDELPLGRVLRLRLVELARISGTVVLLAEHDGGEGLAYEWRTSAGTLERLADDVIAVHFSEGVSAPCVQVGVFGASAAAVASFAFNDEAG